MFSPKKEMKMKWLLFGETEIQQESSYIEDIFKG